MVGTVTRSALGPPAAEGAVMASESAQVLTEMILNGPEIVLIEHVLVTGA